MVDLTALNLVLDIILKLLAITLLVFVFLIMKHIDDVVKSIGRGTESLEKSAKTVKNISKAAKYLPFVGGKEDGK